MKKKKKKTLLEREVSSPGRAKKSKINNVSGNGGRIHKRGYSSPGNR